MPVIAANTQSGVATRSPRRWKPVLWAIMAAMTISVVLHSEVPLLRKLEEQAYLRTIPWLIVPHVTAGVLALLSGPLQFSARLRRRYTPFHRVLGRVYVVSVCVAAPLAILLGFHRHDPRARFFPVAISVQAGVWLLTTAAAFLTARNRHIQQHREWMVRSYAVTFTFILTRVLQPFQFWTRHGEEGFAIEIILITFLAILVPDLAFHWKELTTRRR